jgi:hypothetical protein
MRLLSSVLSLALASAPAGASVEPKDLTAHPAPGGLASRAGKIKINKQAAAELQGQPLPEGPPALSGTQPRKAAAAPTPSASGKPTPKKGSKKPPQPKG